MENSYRNYISIFKALSDETRLKIVEMLSKGELCACKILCHFDITQPTLSYHMKILCDSGLLTSRREGPWVHYALSPKTFQLVENFVNEIGKSKENWGVFREDC